jgi:hypothetical protein
LGRGQAFHPVASLQGEFHGIFDFG